MQRNNLKGQDTPLINFEGKMRELSTCGGKKSYSNVKECFKVVPRQTRPIVDITWDQTNQRP